MEPENQQKTICTAESDLESVKRYQNGDQQELRALLDIHLRLIKFWVRKVLAWADRDEVMQEARIGFSNAAQEFDVSAAGDFHEQAKTYVIRSVHNSRAVMPVRRTLYKHYREVLKHQDELMQELDRMPTTEEVARKTKLSVRQVENALSVIAAFPDRLEGEDGKLAIKEPFEFVDPYQKQLLKDALKKLNRDDAELVIYDLQGLTDREIAERLGKSEGAVKMARTRALKKLRDIISGEGV